MWLRRRLMPSLPSRSIKRNEGECSGLRMGLISLFFYLFFSLGIQLSTDPDWMLDQAKTKWQIIVKHYAGVISVAAVGLLLAAIIPIAGVFVCCCRCAGMISHLSIGPSHAGRNQFHGLKEMGNLRSRCLLKLR